MTKNTAVLFLVLLNACGALEKLDAGADAQAHKSSLAAIDGPASAAQCPNGGNVLDYGIDENGNGVLDPSEINGSFPVCNGDTGKTTLAHLTPESADANCAFGGNRLDTGVDENGDGVLNPNEATAFAFICNGGDSADICETLSFSSSSTYVQIADAADLGFRGNQMTLEAWVNPADVSSHSGIISKGLSNTIQYSLFIDSGQYHLNLYNGSQNPGAGGGTATANRWSHVAGTWDGNSIQIWQDGVNVTSSSVGGTEAIAMTSDTSPAYIGLNAGTSWNYAGQIDEVRLSNVARYTSTFIPKTRFATDSNTVALYHFDEGTGTSAGDSSGNGHVGTLSGSVAWDSACTP